MTATSMRRRLNVFRIVLFSVFLAHACAAQDRKAPVAPSNVSYAQLLEQPSRVEDDQFRYGDDPLQLIRLWLPSNSDKVSRLVVLIHGGCWLNQFDMMHTFPIATMLAQNGYAVWSVEYRRTGDDGGGWPGTFNDIKSGIDLIAKTDSYGIKDASYVIAGHSAGGHLALLAGREHPQARAVIGLAAISDIEAYAQGGNDCEAAVPLFMGSSPDGNPQAYLLANPAQLETHQNTTLLHGTADDIVGIDQSTLAGAQTQLVEGAGHFDWVFPGTEASELLLKVLKEAF